MPRRRWVGERKWRRRLRLMLFWLAVALLLGLAVVALVSFITGRQWSPVIKWINSHRSRSGFGGDVAGAIVFALAPILIGLGIFLTRPYVRVRHRYVRRAIESPTDLVPTAGIILGEVIGRDDLCDTLVTELRTRTTRRPHVLVGGLGAGKTAVLVQLTRVLARRGAVPVPVRLRDATGTEELDFLALARDRFLESVRGWVHSAEEGNKIWQQLLSDDRIVVLADGLEEAFADQTELSQARHHRVRVAVKQAGQRGYALLCASRPHDALRGLDAAITHLEPLSEQAALEYVSGAEERLEDAIADPLIDVAQITEVPLYLRVARDLHDEGLLRPCIDPACHDRIAMRGKLLNSWLDALVAGKLHDSADVPLTEAERRSTVEHLAALAYLGLTEDTQHVTLEMWNPTGRRPAETAGRDGLQAERDRIGRFAKAISGHIQKASRGAAAVQLEDEIDMQTALSNGFRLGLVEPVPSGGRFPHSLVQACLGSRMVGVALTYDKAGLEKALEKPGRELLFALALFSRQDPAQPMFDDTDVTEGVDAIRSLLRQRVNGAKQCKMDPKWLDIVATAVDLDSRPDAPRRNQAEQLSSDEERTPVARAIMQVGRTPSVATRARQRRDVRRSVPAHTVGGDSGNGRGELVDIALLRPWPSIAGDDATIASKRNLVEHLGDAARALAERDSQRARGFYAYLYDICIAESDYGVRLAAAQEIGAGGDRAWESLEKTLVCHSNAQGAWEDWNHVLSEATRHQRSLQHDIEADRDGWLRFVRGAQVQRAHVICAWVMPMLLSSVTALEYRDALDQQLGEWIKCVGERQRDGGMPLSVEAALAQGFKYAANRRPHHSHEGSEARAMLQKHARTMIHAARFWYSRLSLLHALCLWQLDSELYAGHDGHSAPADDRKSSDRQEPYSLVSGWLRRAGRGGAGVSEEGHRFVLEAAELCCRALETRQPQRFLWIDEYGVVTKVGAKAARQQSRRGARLWITPSAGWMTLDRRAQQLVGDVLILLNLAEREHHSEARERGLQKANGDELPQCITGERFSALQPNRAVGAADVIVPGQACRAKCPAGLCPYPARGLHPYRGELSQAFCRRQAILAQRWLNGGPAPWQQGSRTDLSTFWAGMERRTLR